MQRSKIFSALLSLVIAFGMWLYVITVDNPAYTDTIYDIPVVFTSETVMNEKGLIRTDNLTATVDLTLTGNRTDVLKCDKSNVTIKVDLSKVYEEGTHNLEYTISYPSGVASNAFSVEKDPSTIPVTVTKWDRNEIPVNVICEGTVPEGYFADTENVVKDFPTVTVSGPSAVVEKIEAAVIKVDLTDQKESISQSYRYTLVDSNGEPVDAELIEVNVEEVHLDVKIQYVKDVKLVINLVDGGGANANNVKLDYEPRSIKMAGSEAVLEELDEIVLGTINLADYLETTEFTYTIPELEGVTNLSGVTEVTATLSFPSLIIKEFVVEEFEIVNVPEGMKVELITEKLPIKIRGLSGDVSRLTAEDIIVTVDFTGAQIGTSTFKVTVTFGDSFSQLGAVGIVTVTATVQEK